MTNAPGRMGVVVMADRLTLETGTTGIMNDATKQIALAAVAIYAIIVLLVVSTV
jgi:hypothetical protein